MKSQIGNSPLLCQITRWQKDMEKKTTMHLHLFDEFAYPWGISRPGFKWPKFCGSFCIPPLDMPPFQRPSAGRALHEGGVGRIVLKTHREIRLQPALLGDPENRAQNSLQSGAL